MRGRYCYNSCKVQIEIYRVEELVEGVVVVVLNEEVEVVERKFVQWKVWRGRYFKEVVAIVVVVINLHHLNLPPLVLPLWRMKSSNH